nr:putative ribonuclease H-like domain-containing protein [Tanacetum cinerariifolium]
MDHKVKTIRCDNRTEFKNRIMNKFCEMKGIRREFSVARTPQQNGVAERKNKTLIEVQRAQKMRLLMMLERKVLKFQERRMEFRIQQKKVTKMIKRRILEIKKRPLENNVNKNLKDSLVKERLLTLTALTDLTLNEFKSMSGQDKDGNSNKMFTLVSVARSTYVNLGGSIPVNATTLPNDDLPTDPLMLDLEDTAHLQDTGIFSGAYDDEVKGVVADLNNLELTTVVSPIPITRIHKDHPKEQITGDLLLAPQTRRITKTSQEHAMVMQRDDGIFISQDKYVVDILKKFDFSSVKITSTPIETNKALLKDEEAKDMDVHLYRSMIGSLMDSPFDLEAFLDSDYAGASLDRKSTIVMNLELKLLVAKVSTNEQKLVLNGCFDRNETSANDEIQIWTTAKVKNVNEEVQIQALVDKKKVFANMKREGKDFYRKVTCLFQSMMVQVSENMGKGSGIPTDTHHTPIITQPSSSPSQKKKQKSRKKQRKEIEVPSPCSEIPNEEGVLTTSNDPLPSEAKTAQAKEIASLKKRVKKLEQKRKSRTLGFKRLRKGRMNKEDMFGVNDLDGDEVVVDVSASEKLEQSVKVVEKEVNTANPVTTVEIKATKPKAITTTATIVTTSGIRPKEKEIVMQEPSKTPLPKPITSSQNPSQAKDKGKGKMVEPERPLKRKDQIMMDAKIAKNLEAQMQAEFKEEERLARLKEEETNIALKAVEGSENAEEGSSKRARSNLEQEYAKRQRLEEENESVELKRCLEIIPKDDDDVTIEATPLYSKSPTIVDYKIYKEGKKSYFKIIRAYGNSQSYLTFGKMFKNFNREDLEVLWSIVKARFKKKKLIDDMDNLLFQTLKTMFEHHVEDNILKYQQDTVKVLHWKLFDSCGVYCVTTHNMVYYLLVEKMYPFTRNFLLQMWNDMRL